METSRKKKFIKQKFSAIIEVYLSDISTKQGIQGTFYDKSKLIYTWTLFNLSCKYTKFSLGFNWILRLKCRYMYYITYITIVF